MRRIGEVVQKEGDLLTVVFERPTACGHCAGCGMAGRCEKIELPGEAEVGDGVEVEMPEKTLLRATAIAYVLPLAALIAGLLAGLATHGPLAVSLEENLYCALTGLAAFAAGLLIAWLADKRLRGKQGWMPRVAAVIGRGEAGRQ